VVKVSKSIAHVKAMAIFLDALAQHFLLSRAARTLSLMNLCDLSEEASHLLFRWM